MLKWLPPTKLNEDHEFESLHVLQEETAAAAAAAPPLPVHCCVYALCTQNARSLLLAPSGGIVCLLSHICVHKNEICSVLYYALMLQIIIRQWIPITKDIIRIRHIKGCKGFTNKSLIQFSPALPATTFHSKSKNTTHCILGIK